MSIQTLLNNISKINTIYLDKERNSGANFNIFGMKKYFHYL